jgi:monofunctional biosynthetic peptidoglycan transglycosylase
VRRLLLFALLAVLLYAGYVIWGLPSHAEVSALATKNPGKTGVMRQREQEALAARRQPRTTQVSIPISRISRNLIQAVIASEDEKFFGHEGVDWDAIKESLEKDIAKRRFAVGGSTITQQLAKNLFFSTRKSVTRKLRELVVTRWLEAELSKKRILELYLNVIEWGDGVYGVEAAARRYYGKSASELSEDEAAGLAAMIPNPRRINPKVSPALFARAKRRVEWLMTRAGYLKGEAARLGAEPPPVAMPEEESGAELIESDAPGTPETSVTPHGGASR